ncbi:hypothetical protein HK101_005094, partial [Irineochytrium annulatum]
MQTNASAAVVHAGHDIAGVVGGAEPIGSLGPIDLLGGVILPNCPYPSSSIPAPIHHPDLTGGHESSPLQLQSLANHADQPPNEFPTLRLHSPAISSTFSLGSFVCFLFAVTILVNHNSVRVFNRSIRHPSVRNSLWAGFFAVYAFSYGIDAIRYMTDLPISGFDIPSHAIIGGGRTVAPEIIDAWLLTSSVLLRSLGIFLLCLALNHQLVHRSPGTRKEPRTLFLPIHGYQQRQPYRAPPARDRDRRASGGSGGRRSPTANTPLRSDLPRGGPGSSYGSVSSLARYPSTGNVNASPGGGGGSNMIGAWPRTPSRRASLAGLGINTAATAGVGAPLTSAQLRQPSRRMLGGGAPGADETSCESERFTDAVGGGGVAGGMQDDADLEAATTLSSGSGSAITATQPPAPGPTV